ncbi:adenylyltransferase/cytidyltransferase family protein [Candidatus Woesearchaeota archaeon]|nr:adenylyltransferase/cytidyltransferase family protein [Candidatus Woesearchaeota archaeon]
MADGRMTVLVFGTFDGLHPGHLHFLHQARERGDRLHVLVARDATVLEVKGRAPEFDENERLLAVRDLLMVDEASLGDPVDRYAALDRVRPDVICLGYDQQAFVGGLKAGLRKRGLRTAIVRLDAFHDDVFKSSKLRRGAAAQRD